MLTESRFFNALRYSNRFKASVCRLFYFGAGKSEHNQYMRNARDKLHKKISFI